MEYFNNLNEFFRARSLKYSGKILFDETITYGEAYNLALRRAAFLRKKKLGKGDVVAILAENSAEWVITYMAITLCGCVALPLDTNLSEKDYFRMTKSVKAKAAFISPAYKKKLKGFPLFEISLDKNIEKKQYISDIQITPDDPATYSFTSGTTGEPKIVVLSHGNIFRSSISCLNYLGINEEDKFLCILPLFHSYAFMANFGGPFNVGASFYFLRSLKGVDIIKTLGEHEFTIFPAAPQLWEIFMDTIINKAREASKFKYAVLMFFLTFQPLFKYTGLGFIPKIVFRPIRKVFGKKMKYFISGGAPLKKKYFRYYKRIGLQIVEGYGLTETNGPIAISHPKKNKEGSVGPVMNGNIPKLKNQNKEGIGEIWLKGISVMNGYYKNDKANKECFDSEGYYNTGDIGKIDKDGYLFITGRSKSTIVLDSGKNVYPAELEAHYKRSSMIEEICVFGRRVAGRETVCAAIVPRKKNSESFALIKKEIASLSKGLPSYKLISNFSLSFDPLPKNTTRKILVHEVIRLVESGKFMTSENDTVETRLLFVPENTKEELVAEVLKKRQKLKEIKSNDTLSDLGLDSLGVIDFASFCEEKFGIRVNVDKIRSADTAENLIKMIASFPEGSSVSIDEKILKTPIKHKSKMFPNPVVSFAFWKIKKIARIFWKAELSGFNEADFENSIIVANHSSNLDSLVMLSLMPKNIRRRVWVISKKELRFIKYLFPGSNGLFVDRGGDIIPAMKAGADILRGGASLLIFPEGTRSSYGVLGKFKIGAAYLSKNISKAVIPAVIKGSSEIWPREKMFPRFFCRKKMTIKFLDPVKPEKYKDVESLNSALEKMIAAELTKELGQKNEKNSGKKPVKLKRGNKRVKSMRLDKNKKRR